MNSILLKEAALKLSPFERAQLIDALWQSLDPVEQTEIDQAWLEESGDRLSAYQRGEIEAVDSAKILSELKEKLSHYSRFGNAIGSVISLGKIQI